MQVQPTSKTIFVLREHKVLSMVLFLWIFINFMLFVLKHPYDRPNQYRMCAVWFRWGSFCSRQMGAHWSHLMGMSTVSEATHWMSQLRFVGVHFFLSLSSIPFHGCTKFIYLSVGGLLGFLGWINLIWSWCIVYTHFI